MEDYDANDKIKVEELNDQAFNQFLGYLYLENGNQFKYGTILIGLNTQQTLKNNQYQKSITKQTMYCQVTNLIRQKIVAHRRRKRKMIAKRTKMKVP